MLHDTHRDACRLGETTQRERRTAMLDPIFLREHPQTVSAGLRSRGMDPDRALEQLATLDTARRRLLPELEALKREQNTSGDQIAQAKRKGVDTTRIQEAN